MNLIEFGESYLSLLREYLREERPSVLLQAEELGRYALRERVSLEEVVACQLTTRESLVGEHTGILLRDNAHLILDLDSHLLQGYGAGFSLIVEKYQLQSQKLAIINRLYSVLQQVGKTVTWKQSEELLFQKICNICVDAGGFRMVWMGLVDERAKQIVPVAYAGAGSECVKDIRIALDISPSGQGPTGQSVREGRPVVINDLARNPKCKPLASAVAEQGYGSSGAFPVEVDGNVIGALSVYALEANFFNTDEIALLEDVAKQVSFALERVAEVDKRKLADETADSKDRMLSTVFSVLPDLFFLLANDGTVLDYRAQSEANLYSPPERFLNKKMQDILPSEASDEFLSRMALLESSRGQIVFDYNLRLAEGDHHYECCLSSLPESDLVMMVVRDKTELGRTEEELRQLAYIVSSTTDMMALMDKDYRFLAINPAYAKAIDATSEQVLGKKVPDILGYDSFNSDMKANADRCLAGEEFSYQRWIEFAALGKRYVDIKFSPYYGNHGQVVGYAVCGRDITESKESDDERMRLISAIEQVAEAVVITDVHGKIEYVNPAFEMITGYTLDETLGKNPRMLKSGLQDHAFYENLWSTLLSGNTWSGRFVNRKKDGTLISEDQVISPIRNEIGDVVNYVAVARDVTKELELEEQFHQAQKMESVGQLAGGVAHDINNMLSVIIGYAEMAQMGLSQDEFPYSELTEIQKAADRSANITKQLLAFARRQTVSPKVLDLNSVVVSTLRMLRRLIGEDVELIWKPGLDLWNIKIDPSQIDQMLANLCINARDAISDGGCITIETKNATLDEAFCLDNVGSTTGDFVRVSIRDDGCGMDSSVLEHIFEPFYTTKEVGVGTGLGLATVYGVVKQNDGFIYATSKPDEGTTFTVYLPRYESTVDEKRGDVAVKTPRGRGETILLVEDEPSVLELGELMLRKLGYEVLATNQPDEALQLFRQHLDRIQLLITDVVMPVMDGQRLLEQIQSIKPGLRCLYMSGYPADVIAKRGILDEGLSFMQKPFDMKALASKVREILDDLGVEKIASISAPR